MNVGMIAYTFYETDNRVRRYAEELARLGHRVDMFALRKPGVPRHAMINGVHLHRVQYRQYNERSTLAYLYRTLLFMLRVGLWMIPYHVRRRYKLLHIHNVPDFHVFAGLFPRLLGARIILDIHDILPEFFCEKFGRESDSRLARMLRLTERVCVRFADHVIVANDLWRNKIMQRDQLPQDRCTALLNYPDPRYFLAPALGSPNGRLTMIYPGTVSYLHGVDVAIRAVSVARKEFPDLELHIYANYGNLDYYHSLLDLQKRLGLDSNVFFHDPVPIEELGGIYSRATLGVVPKRGGIFSGEAFSTKILEFMAAGLPIVASRTKIDEFYFDDEMITFFEPENSDDMARSIVQLARNPQRLRSQVEHCRRFISDNTWDRKKALYVEIVNRLTA